MNKLVTRCYQQLMLLIQNNQDLDYKSMRNIIQQWITTNPNLINENQSTLDTLNNILLEIYVNYHNDYNTVLSDLRNRLKQGKFNLLKYITDRVNFYFNNDALSQLFDSYSDMDELMQVLSDLLDGIVKQALAQYVDANIANILKNQLTPEQQSRLFDLWKNGDLTADALFNLIKDNVYDRTKLAYLTKAVTSNINSINPSILSDFLNNLISQKIGSIVDNKVKDALSKLEQGIIASFDQLKQELGIDDLLAQKDDLQQQLDDLQNQLNSGEITQEEFDRKVAKINTKLDLIAKALMKLTNILNNIKKVQDLLDSLDPNTVKNLIDLIKASKDISDIDSKNIDDLVKVVNDATKIDNIDVREIPSVIKYLNTVKLSDTPVSVKDNIEQNISDSLKKSLSIPADKQLLDNLTKYLSDMNKRYNELANKIVKYIKDNIKSTLSGSEGNAVIKTLNSKLFNVYQITPEHLKDLIDTIASNINQELTPTQRKDLIDKILDTYNISIKPKNTSTDPLSLKSLFNDDLLKKFIQKFLKNNPDVLLPDFLTKDSLLALLALALGLDPTKAFSLNDLLQAVKLSQKLKNLGLTPQDIIDQITKFKLNPNEYTSLKNLMDKTNNSSLDSVVNTADKLNKASISDSDLFAGKTSKDQDVEISNDDINSVNDETKSTLAELSVENPMKNVPNSEYYKLMNNSAQMKIISKKFPTTGVPDEILNSSKNKYVFKIKKTKTTPAALKMGPLGIYIDHQLIRPTVTQGDTVEDLGDKINQKYAEVFNTTDTPAYVTDQFLIILSDPVDINPQLTEYSPNTIDRTVIDVTSYLADFDSNYNTQESVYPGDIPIKKYKITAPTSDDFVSDSKDQATITYHQVDQDNTYTYTHTSTIDDFINDLVSTFKDKIITNKDNIYFIASTTPISVDKSGFKDGEVEFTELPPTYNKPITSPTVFASNDPVDVDNTVDNDTVLTTTIDGISIDTNIPAGTSYGEAINLVNNNLQDNGINTTLQVTDDGTLLVTSNDLNNDIEFTSDEDILPAVNQLPNSEYPISNSETAEAYQDNSDNTPSFSQYTGTTAVDPTYFQSDVKPFPNLPDPTNTELNSALDSILNDDSLTDDEKQDQIDSALDTYDTTDSNPFNIDSTISTNGSQEYQPTDSTSKKHKSKWAKFVRELSKMNGSNSDNSSNTNAMVTAPSLSNNESGVSVPDWSVAEATQIASSVLQDLGLITKPIPASGEYDMTDLLPPVSTPPNKLDQIADMLDAVDKTSPSDFVKMLNQKLPPWLQVKNVNGNLVLSAGYTLDLSSVPAIRRLNRLMNMNLNRKAQNFIDNQLKKFNMLLLSLLSSIISEFGEAIAPFFKLFAGLNSVLNAALAGGGSNSKFCSFGFSLPQLSINLAFSIIGFHLNMPTLDLDALINSIVAALKAAIKSMLSLIKSALNYIYAMVRLLVKTAKDLLKKAFWEIVKSYGMITCDIIATIANVARIISAAIKIAAAIARFASSVKPPHVSLSPGKISSKMSKAKSSSKGF